MMVEERCFFNKDTLVVKAPKKTHIALKMFMLVTVTICGIYICSVCTKQIRMQSRPRILKFEIIKPPCKNSSVSHREFAYLHYPSPVTHSREECACTPVHFFSIVSMQRSGSGWFETLLNSHVNISSNGEIFSPKERRTNISTIIRALDKVYNLDWFSSASKNECTAAAGFKWMLNQGLMDNCIKVIQYFRERGVSVIFLFRRNLLRRLVSQLANDHDRSTKQLNGTHKAHVHSENEANILAMYKPRINTSELISNLKNAEKFASDALEHFNNIRHIVLYYEDLLQNSTKMMDVLEFLKVPHRKLVSRHVKIHTKPLPSLIENWDEIYTSLKGTEYESFLKADYVS
ncbi:nodulation protein H-like [Zingiber officinale]|uniref:nodulation protein H-like n=1 Tax=Zingiber officinale TaxID=94328 RepID=UPI001C4B6942|nr:nodulation protein H-like [Zingiber officinale]XP_042413347.1 nodulation protein H-like [Zingiber officinale]XP_042418027.1 nodulation protein H-like [Zingiber officinale]XP_042418028.1 nodulation protein H-like [Zingiber officinale]